MSKEEIVDKYLIAIQDDYHKDDVLNMMDEYASQESEKKAVAFAEWKHAFVVHGFSSYSFMKTGEIEPLIFETTSNLYQYWITNVYNK